MCLNMRSKDTPNITTSLAKEKEKPLLRKDRVTAKTIQDRIAPTFSLNNSNKKTISSKIPIKSAGKLSPKLVIHEVTMFCEAKL